MDPLRDILSKKQRSNVFSLKEEGFYLKSERRLVETNMTSRKFGPARGKKGSVELVEREVNIDKVRGIEV